MLKAQLNFLRHVLKLFKIVFFNKTYISDNFTYTSKILFEEYISW